VSYLSPVGPARKAHVDRAPRLATLEGVTIGVIENSKPNADRLFAGVCSWLGETYGAQVVRYYQKPSAAIPATSDWYETLSKEVQIVLAGTGD
jgi:hypothetical protein